ncbi:MAG: hypothetical protein Q7T11_00750 [Deltaproteobacteria bacterium]|nr:hypothetical protein [Deltaproteobacteria bacterium]
MAVENLIYVALGPKTAATFDAWDDGKLGEGVFTSAGCSQSIGAKTVGVYAIHLSHAQFGRFAESFRQSPYMAQRGELEKQIKASTVVDLIDRLSPESLFKVTLPLTPEIRAILDETLPGYPAAATDVEGLQKAVLQFDPNQISPEQKKGLRALILKLGQAGSQEAIIKRYGAAACNLYLFAVRQETLGVPIWGEHHRSFSPEELETAIGFLGSLPEKHLSLVSSIARLEKCPTGKCVIAGEMGNGEIQIYDSFFDEKTIAKYLPESANAPMAQRLQRSLSHELAHRILHEETHKDFEKLRQFYSGPPYQAKYSLSETAAAENTRLEDTIMYRWAQINSWSLSTEANMNPEIMRNTFLLMLQKEHGEKLADLVAQNEERGRTGQSIFWLRAKRAWQVQQRAFVTKLAANVEQGPENSLSETIAYYLTNRAEFEAMATMSRALRAQLEFIKKEFFPG